MPGHGEVGRREEGRRSGLVVVLTVLALELVRASGPLLDSLYSRDGVVAVAAGAVLTYAAPAPLAALLLLVARRAARPGRAAVLAGTALLAALRLLLQGSTGEVRVVVGLVAVAVAVAVLVLALAAVLPGPGGGRTAAAAVLAGAAGSVGLQLALGTWDAAWRPTPLGWGVAVGVSGLALLLAAWPAEEERVAEGRPGRLALVGPVLALAAVVLANPAAVTAPSRLPLALVGPLLGLGLLLAALLTTRRQPAVWSRVVAAAVLPAGTAVALLATPASAGGGVLVVVAATAAALAAGVVLTAAWSGRPAPASPPSPLRTAAAAGLAGSATILPVLLFQLHYDRPLGFPNVWVLVATAAVPALAGLLGSGAREEAAPSRGARGPLGAVALLLVLGSATVVLGATRTGAGAGAGAPTGRVLSWNLHYGVGADGAVDLEAVARVIEAQDPDVVLLQEVSRGWVQGGGADMATWLAQRLDRHLAFGPAADGRFGNVVLARAPLADVSVQVLPFGAGPQRRSALTARTDVGGRPVSVTSLHLQHRAAGGPTRVAQVETFLRAPVDPPRVVGADLNAEPGAPEVRLLTGAGYVSALDAVGDPAALTAPADRPRRRIDWVLGRGLGFAEARVLAGPPLSDHRPLVVTVAP